ncbi:hypothetical protein MTR_1g084230 [Medicago truncatula]|uniref:Uncharacterized protein n=1 Tax=Medicago truncatula TaxID=3880 RepID=A0A072VNW6_MEDTR|nr:hypothetical protein MTR_1g084230 [Medicago truncatula]
MGHGFEGVGVEVLNAESSKRLKKNQSPWNHENKILFVSSVKLSIVCLKEITRPLSRICLKEITRPLSFFYSHLMDQSNSSTYLSYSLQQSGYSISREVLVD